MTLDEQSERVDIIISAICAVGKVSYCNLLSHTKSLYMNILRGVAFYLSWEYNVHPRMMSILMRRSRANVINQSKRYRGYIQCGDPLTIDIYDHAKKMVEKEI